jgi:tRNA pseudouridine55 synthase
VADPFGFLNVDKPLHLTSHDVVARLRRQLGIKKIGHAGTLDPLATGVLVICVGGATRLSDEVMHATKGYLAQVRLGVTTETYDAEGAVTAEQDASHLQREQVEAALTGFRGTIQQVPPMYSAIKQGGRKLYELARAGETVERAARTVTIEALTLSAWTPPTFTLEVVCSAGTYIRSLAYDVGRVLGVGAYLSGLVRTASGHFRLDNAQSMEQLLEGDWQASLIAPQTALAGWPSLVVSAADAAHLVQGRAITAPEGAEGRVLAYTEDGHLVALVQADGSLWRPHKVFLSG